MDDAPLPPDTVTMAEALVAQRKAKLEAACAEARTSRSRDDWLADCPDLLRLKQLISDHPHRRSRLSEAKGTYQGAYQKRLAETQRDCPFQIPFLERADELIGCRAFPVHLPRIGGKTILSRWIDHVLKPLVEHWHLICCPACGGSSTRSGTIRLDVTRMTSEGTVYGRMTCGQCSKVADRVTLLTHCHKCGHYPLIIGKNSLCTSCKGLSCAWRQQDTDTACGCCKKNCQQRQT